MSFIDPLHLEKTRQIYQQPFNDLLHQAHQTHVHYHPANKIQVAELLSIKTGACPEDCGYCSQSGHFKTHVEKEKLLDIESVVTKAKAAKARGATRYCMGAAWRNIPAKAMPQLVDMIQSVKSLGLETCMTLGMLDEAQAKQLKAAGLDYYNHNIDTSPSYYAQVVTTRQFSDRLHTLNTVRNAGIKVCCGGILGLGEAPEDRLEFLSVLATMSPAPESVPINRLIPVAGTPLAKARPLDDIELVRTIACARILMPESVIRLTAGRTEMSDILQAVCFFAGANSIFIGDVLLTEDNPQLDKDKALFAALGLEALGHDA
ncbi:MAG: biotin synthase BioB [Legionellaceae bacterium]|nr:biotin synthase BioB [Legionellaceae bacterium]